MTRAGALAVLAAVASVAGLTAAPPDPVLEGVLVRAGQYVLDFERQLSGVVAEETYVQTATRAGGAALMPGGRRQMKSDLLMVKPVGSARYMAFRDVFEVDGKELRDRQDRLMKLFLEPGASTAAQIRQIAEESSRFNIGRVYRNINVPPFALAFLDPAVQRSFKFKTINARRAELQMSSPPPASAMSIAYEETGRPTLIRNGDRDIPSHGRLWIDPLSGRVLMTELLADNTDVAACVVVIYAEQPGVPVPVPIEMRERYIRRRDGSRAEGVATYGRFRQFQVKVDENIAPVGEKAADAPAAPTADKPVERVINLDDTLRRAGEYVTAFERDLSGIVAEETYAQLVVPRPGDPEAGAVRVELRSDLLVVKPIGGDHYVGFRDVFEVNRKSVHDRQDRLMNLFLNPDASTAGQARAIAEESSRFNIGDVDRNINVPTFALTILEPGNQRRFTFRAAGSSRPGIINVPAGETAVVQFEETARPTLVRTKEGGNAPARGRFWIDAAGRIVASEIVVESRDDRAPVSVIATIDVAYRREEGIQPLVPATMHERYDVGGTGRHIDGVAIYGRFRQFQVKVDEKIAPIRH